MFDVLCGKLLGDGSIVKAANRKPRFQFTHRKQDFAYCQHCFELLSHILPLSSPAYKKNIDPRLIAGFSESFYVQSRTSEIFTYLYELWYPEAIKRIPFSFLESNFTDRTLAIWYQDDGHLKQKNGTIQKIILSTESFTVEENQTLIEFLRSKYSLHFSLDVQNRLLLYDQYQIIRFLHIVNPYIHPSMNRKKRTVSVPKELPERTTIYLPSDISLKRPTSEINEQYKKLPLLTKLAIKNPELLKQFESESCKSYQIKIAERHRKDLVHLKYLTGLNISQLTTFCFHLDLG